MPFLAFTVALASFALLLTASIFGGLARDDVDFLRTHATAWSMTLLATPPMYLFVSRYRRQPPGPWWLWFWSFGWLMCIVHFHFGLFHMHDGRPLTVFQRQGFGLAFSIFFFLGVWGLDVLAAFVRGLLPRSRVARVVPAYGVANSFAFLVGFLTFFISTVLFQNDRLSLVVGLIMTAAVVAGLVRRLRPPAPGAPS